MTNQERADSAKYITALKTRALEECVTDNDTEGAVHVLKTLSITAIASDAIEIAKLVLISQEGK